jgi:hydroxymethylbilane synthase
MRVGTRGSMLALAQARLVVEWLGEGEIVVVRTPHDGAQASGHAHGPGMRTPANGRPRPTGGGADAPPTHPPADSASAAPGKPGGGDKSRWVAGLEQALLAGEIELAVHSAKDVPGALAAGLELLGAPVRAAAEDALVGAGSLQELPEGGYVGTSSVRRAAQLRAARDDLHVVSLRGNVDTRLRKLANRTGGSSSALAGHSIGEGPRARAGHPAGAHEDAGAGTEDEPRLDAIVLARAGLQRLGRERDIGCVLDAARFVPAPGQGLLALQARGGDVAVRTAVEPILDSDASACLRAERALARALDASCNTPLGAHAAAAGCGCLLLRAWVGLPDGSEWVADELLGGFYDPEELGRRVAQRLEAVGAGDLLRRAEEAALERP